MTLGQDMNTHFLERHESTHLCKPADRGREQLCVAEDVVEVGGDNMVKCAPEGQDVVTGNNSFLGGMIRKGNVPVCG